MHGAAVSPYQPRVDAFEDALEREPVFRDLIDAALEQRTHTYMVDWPGHRRHTRRRDLSKWCNAGDINDVLGLTIPKWHREGFNRMPTRQSRRVKPRAT